VSSALDQLATYDSPSSALAELADYRQRLPALSASAVDEIRQVYRTGLYRDPDDVAAVVLGRHPDWDEGAYQRAFDQVAQGEGPALRARLQAGQAAKGLPPPQRAAVRRRRVATALEEQPGPPASGVAMALQGLIGDPSLALRGAGALVDSAIRTAANLADITPTGAVLRAETALHVPGAARTQREMAEAPQALAEAVRRWAERSAGEPRTPGEAFTSEFVEEGGRLAPPIAATMLIGGPGTAALKGVLSPARDLMLEAMGPAARSAVLRRMAVGVGSRALGEAPVWSVATGQTTPEEFLKTAGLFGLLGFPGDIGAGAGPGALREQVLSEWVGAQDARTAEARAALAETLGGVAGRRATTEGNWTAQLAREKELAAQRAADTARASEEQAAANRQAHFARERQIAEEKRNADREAAIAAQRKRGKMIAAGRQLGVPPATPGTPEAQEALRQSEPYLRRFFERTAPLEEAARVARIRTARTAAQPAPGTPEWQAQIEAAAPAFGEYAKRESEAMRAARRARRRPVPAPPATPVPVPSPTDLAPLGATQPTPPVAPPRAELPPRPIPREPAPVPVPTADQTWQEFVDTPATAAYLRDEAGAGRETEARQALQAQHVRAVRDAAAGGQALRPEVQREYPNVIPPAPPATAPPPAPEVSPEELHQRVLAAIPEQGATPDTITTTSGLPIQRVLSTLTLAEMKGDVARDGSLYRRTRVPEVPAAPAVEVPAPVVPTAAPSGLPPVEPRPLRPAERRARAARPAATSAAAKTDRFGLTVEQRDFLTGRLQTIARERVAAGETALTSTVPAGQQTIKVPGDGDFEVRTLGQATALHKQVTGDAIPVEGLAPTTIPRYRVPGPGRPPVGITHPDPMEQAIATYGTAERAAQALERQLEVVRANPKEYPGVDLPGVEALIHQLYGRARPAEPPETAGEDVTYRPAETLPAPATELPFPGPRGVPRPAVAAAGVRRTRIVSERLLPGTKPIGKQDVLRMWQVALRSPSRVGRVMRGAVGQFNWVSRVMRLKRANELPTAWHEGGHVLDQALNLSKWGDADPVVGRELLDMGRPTSKASYTKAQVVKEGVANFVRFWMRDPEMAVDAYPNFGAAFELSLDSNPALRKGVEGVQNAYKEWRDQNPVDVARAEILTPRQAEAAAQPVFPLLGRLGRASREVFDESVALHDALKQSGAIVRAGRHPGVTERLATTTAAGRYEQAIERGWWDIRQNRKVAASMRDIVTKAQSGGRPIEEFEAWATLRHARDVLGRGMDVPWERATIEGALRTLDRPEFHEAAKLLQDYQRQLRSLIENEMQMVVPGWSSMMEEKWPNYVPLMRLFTEHFAGEGPSVRTRGLDIPSVVQRLRGSGRPVLSPLVEIQRRTRMYLELAERLKVRRELADVADRTPDFGWIMEKVRPKMHATPISADLAKHMARHMAEMMDAEGVGGAVRIEDMAAVLQDHAIWQQVLRGSGKENVLGVWRRGKVELYQVHPDVLPVMTKLDTTTRNWWMKPLVLAKQIARTTSTVLSPKFMFLRNPVRDWPTAIMQSPGYSPMVGYMYKALKAIALKEPIYETFVAAGGKQGAAQAIAMEPGDLGEAFRVAGLHLEGARQWAEQVRRVGRAFEEAGAVVENVPRFAVFLKELQARVKNMEDAQKAGIWEDAVRESALAAREATVPFERGGIATKKYGAVKAFFNAGFQGPHAVYRAYRARPLETTIKGIAYLTVPTLLNYAVNHDNPDWQVLPAYRKYTGWNIAVGKDRKGETRFLWVPYPWEWGAIFCAPVLAAAEHMRTHDPAAWKQMLGAAARVISPADDPVGILPDIMAPLVEATVNRDWRHRPIVPAGASNLPPGMQATGTTSEVGRLVGKTLNYPPAKVDYLLGRYFGTVGRDTLAVLDAAVAKTGHGVKPVSVRDEPGALRGVLIKASYDSQLSEDFYQELGRLEQASAGEREGGPKMKGAERNRLAEARRLSAQLADLRTQKRHMIRSRQLPEAKARRADIMTARGVRWTCYFMHRQAPDWAQAKVAGPS